MAGREHLGIGSRSGTAARALQGWFVFRVATGGRTDAWARRRLSARRTAGSSEERGGVCRDSGARQVDLQCQWAAGSLREKDAREAIYGNLYRLRLLLQCGR